MVERTVYPWSIWIGFDNFDKRALSAFAVARHSARKRMNGIVPIYGVMLDALRDQGLYWRATDVRNGTEGQPILWDRVSDAPMSTEFAISRFLVPVLARRGRKTTERAGWALFMDCDVLVRSSLCSLFEEIQHRKEAVICVKHQYQPPPGQKMDGQIQLNYTRKNWSSFMLFNCDHPANQLLTVDMVNSLPGRDLHRFCWLEDREIGEIGTEWNYLVGHTPPSVDPKVVHFTEGGPWLPAYRDVPYAEEWREMFENWLGRG